MATTKCPFCAEEIQEEAIVCKHCKRDLPLSESEQTQEPRQSTKAGKKSSPLGWMVTKWLGILVMVNAIANAVRKLSEGPQIEPGRPTTGSPWGDLVSDLLTLLIVGYVLYRWGSGKEKQIRQRLENEEEMSGESSNHSD